MSDGMEMRTECFLGAWAYNRKSPGGGTFFSRGSAFRISTKLAPRSQNLNEDSMSPDRRSGAMARFPLPLSGYAPVLECGPRALAG